MVAAVNQHLEIINTFEAHKWELDLTSKEPLRTVVRTANLSAQLFIRPMIVGAIGGSCILGGRHIIAHRPAAFIGKQVFTGSIIGALLGGVWTGCKFFLTRESIQKKKESTDLEETRKKEAQKAKDFFKRIIDTLSNNLEEGSDLIDSINYGLFCIPVKVCQIGEASHIFEYDQIKELLTKEDAKCPTCRGEISPETIQLAIEARQKVSQAIGTKISQELSKTENDALKPAIKKTLTIRNQRIDRIFGCADNLRGCWGKSLRITVVESLS